MPRSEPQREGSLNPETSIQEQCFLGSSGHLKPLELLGSLFCTKTNYVPSLGCSFPATSSPPFPPSQLASFPRRRDGQESVLFLTLSPNDFSSESTFNTSSIKYWSSSSKSSTPRSICLDQQTNKHGPSIVARAKM